MTFHGLILNGLLYVYYNKYVMESIKLSLTKTPLKDDVDLRCCFLISLLKISQITRIFASLL